MPLLASVILGLSAVFANPAAAAPFCPIVQPPLAPPDSSGPAATLLADEVSLQNDVAIAEGNVRLEQQGQALEAPRLRYNRETATVRASQGAKYYRSGIYVTAEQARVQIDADTGEFSDANYVLLSSGGRGEAARAKQLGDGKYVLTDASYTTCVGATKAWLLTASTVEIDQQAGRGEVWNSVLHIYGLPVFYFPYFNFPIDDRRHTGFLVPVYGSSTDTGTMVALPYYINLAPNYDATLVPRYLGERGLQFSGQFRYLFRHHIGELEGAWLPGDDQYEGRDRWLVDYEHRGKLLPHLGVELRYSQVSDIDYFDGLESHLAETSESHLQQSVRLVYENTGIRFTALAETFQNLNLYDYGPYERLPQLRLELNSPTAPFYAGIDLEYTAFVDENNIDARRFDARPHVNWAMDTGGWYASAEAALRYTHYSFADEPYGAPSIRGESIDRSIPVLSFGGGLRFTRTLDNGWLQTLEPRFFYLYKGYEEQTDIPLFDTAAPVLNFARLFSTERFIGADRIVDANQLALGISSRLIEPDSGRTVLQFDFGRIQNFEAPRVTWHDSAGPARQNIQTGYNDDGSNFVLGIEYAPTGNFSAGLIAQYDPEDSNLDRAIAHVNYRHDSGFRISLAWRRYEDFRALPRVAPDYTTGATETLEQVQLGLAFPIGDSLDVYGRWDYSLQQDKDVHISAGLEYRPSCCWATRLSWQRNVSDDRYGTYETAFMFQFVLRGLGAFGTTFDLSQSGETTVP